jgi:hypothetical protein
VAKPRRSSDEILLRPAGNSRPRARSNGTILLRSSRALFQGKLALGELTLGYPEQYELEVDEVPITYARLAPIWGSSLRRVRLAASTTPAQNEAVFTLAAA